MKICRLKKHCHKNVNIRFFKFLEIWTKHNIFIALATIDVISPFKKTATKIISFSDYSPNLLLSSQKRNYT